MKTYVAVLLAFAFSLFNCQAQKIFYQGSELFHLAVVDKNPDTTVVYSIVRLKDTLAPQIFIMSQDSKTREIINVKQVFFNKFIDFLNLARFNKNGNIDLCGSQIDVYGYKSFYAEVTLDGFLYKFYTNRSDTITKPGKVSQICNVVQTDSGTYLFQLKYLRELQNGFIVSSPRFELLKYETGDSVSSALSLVCSHIIDAIHGSSYDMKTFGDTIAFVSSDFQTSTIKGAIYLYQYLISTKKLLVKTIGQSSEKLYATYIDSTGFSVLCGNGELYLYNRSGKLKLRKNLFLKEQREIFQLNRLSDKTWGIGMNYLASPGNDRLKIVIVDTASNETKVFTSFGDSGQVCMNLMYTKDRIFANALIVKSRSSNKLNGNSNLIYWDLNTNNSSNFNDFDYQMNIFPNPGNDIITISFNHYSIDKVSYELINMMGQKVFSENIDIRNLGNDGNYSFNISKQKLNLLNGLYFIKLNVGNRSVTKKITWVD